MRMWKGKREFINFQMQNLSGIIGLRAGLVQAVKTEEEHIAYFLEIWETIYEKRHREETQIKWDVYRLNRSTPKSTGKIKKGRL